MASEDETSESSFYGDEDEKTRLEELVNTYDPEKYWDGHATRLSTIQHVEKEKEKNRSVSLNKNEAFDNHHAKITTSSDPWIRIFHPDRSTDEIGDIPMFVREGTHLLRGYVQDKTATRSTPNPAKKAALTRRLESDLFALARETGVVSGKWMLFVSREEIRSVWRAVAQATGAGELGVAAKVARDDLNQCGNHDSRLVAVYTRDFEDRRDVARVLGGLKEMGVMGGKGERRRTIYYKCDAWTYLEIKANNPYGLKASLYSSRDEI
ncbi:hypothetical protein ASPZODRAFT_14758 [Penicilliopsis zonata CBS 506.65]|uniref:DUF1917 domain-containing protein n=1 Tax=Penicilliopsis zonata CBS 506.65 TaxID=1073090 RepID=A0A1L9SNE5_9EURO|nr:hypothetical protein ASPZODRAFT_14758 [Penicilliopsis zonata CBS 506.65]OJJ48631.1 hypothetical protein ASPZODRAFT_14758 [Penicilliopsis zonata CBS 506.65]